MEENQKAAQIVLSKEDLEAITKASQEAEIQGDRYPAAWLGTLYADTPPL